MPNSCVLVCGNIKDSTLDERTLELVGAGKELADKLDVELAVAFLGDEIDGVAEEMSFFGVDKVYKLAHPSLGSVSPELWVKALQDLCKEIDPKIRSYAPLIHVVGHRDEIGLQIRLHSHVGLC